MRSKIHDHIIADIDYGNSKDVELALRAFKIVGLYFQGLEYFDHIGFRGVNMDVNLVELEGFFEKFLVLFFPLMGFTVF